MIESGPKVVEFAKMRLKKQKREIQNSIVGGNNLKKQNSLGFIVLGIVNTPEPVMILFLEGISRPDC